MSRPLVPGPWRAGRNGRTTAIPTTATPTAVVAAGLAGLVVLAAVAGLVPSPGRSDAGAGATPPTAWASTPTWTYNVADVGAPIAESSPIVADLDGAADDVVVGDRLGDLYAMSLATGAELPGWPTTDGNGPIDSTPSQSASGSTPTIYVGSGDDSNPSDGGYQAYDASGKLKWVTSVDNPGSDDQPASAVIAGITVSSLQGGRPDVYAGSAGQVSYALGGTNGSPLTGWPFFNSDSTHSTAATADLYGTGGQEVVDGADQTAGEGRGQQYTAGGHVRVLTGDGEQVCRADTNQVVDSSPAVGGFLPGGATGIVTGTGYETGFQTGASDTNTVKAYDTACRQVWSTTLDGTTESSPALADVEGNGRLQVAEATTKLNSAGYPVSSTLWVLDAATGTPLWHAPVPAPVVDGSVVTADLFDQGYQDVIVPTINGAYIYDGRSTTGAAPVVTLDPYLGLQNAPLVTDDPNGSVGITLAGYTAAAQPGGVGRVDHFEIPQSDGADGAEAVGPGSWPMFHHDPQLTGNAGSTTARGSIPPCRVPAAVTPGYNLVASDGGLFALGGSPFCGSAGGLRLSSPVVGMAMAPATGGYWEVGADGGIFAFGGAGFYGSLGGDHLVRPIVGMAATPDGRGYWLVASDGGVFAFGDAQFYGSMGGQPLDSPVVGISPSTDGKGYRLVAADGGIFTYGDAPFLGSMGGQPLVAPIVATVNDTNTGGYWEVAADGGIFAFGGAPFFGSMGGHWLRSRVVGMAETSDGSGYRLAAADGGIFSFGSAPFLGSMGGASLRRPIVGMAGF